MWNGDRILDPGTAVSQTRTAALGSANELLRLERSVLARPPTERNECYAKGCQSDSGWPQPEAGALCL